MLDEAWLEDRPKNWVGVISDTHGLLRPEALQALRGCELIIHAGDVGQPQILGTLRRIAPVVAVRGNVDAGEWANELPETQSIEWSGRKFYVLHDLGSLDLDPGAAGLSVVISGHSHRAEIRDRGGVLYLNPGSAGPRRFRLPISLACLWLGQEGLTARVIELANGLP